MNSHGVVGGGSGGRRGRGGRGGGTTVRRATARVCDNVGCTINDISNGMSL